MLWGKATTQAWMAAASDDALESSRNCLSLSPQALAYWSHPYFALKPLPPEPAEGQNLHSIRLQFFWLPTGDPARWADFACFPGSYGEVASVEGKAMLWNDSEEGRQIKSGEIITFGTSDPVTKPLPSLHLLQMQWYMNRVVALCGAGKREDFDVDIWYCDI